MGVRKRHHGTDAISVDPALIGRPYRKASDIVEGTTKRSKTSSGRTFNKMSEDLRKIYGSDDE